MSIPDETFREAFKPLHIPAHYAAEDTEQNKVIFGLAQIGEGSPADVAKALLNADHSIDAERFTVIAASVLNGLFEKGLIKGAQSNGIVRYNLSKITEANEGSVNPALLAPGLD